MQDYKIKCKSGWNRQNAKDAKVEAIVEYAIRDINNRMKNGGRIKEWKDYIEMKVYELFLYTQRARGIEQVRNPIAIAYCRNAVGDRNGFT